MVDTCAFDRDNVNVKNLYVSDPIQMLFDNRNITLGIDPDAYYRQATVTSLITDTFIGFNARVNTLEGSISSVQPNLPYRLLTTTLFSAWHLIGFYSSDIIDDFGNKSDLLMEIISHSGTNLPDNNNSSITIAHFKTTQSPTNFKGDCIAYVLGGSLISPSAIKVEQRNSPSTGKPFFYLYAYFGNDSQGTIIKTRFLV